MLSRLAQPSSDPSSSPLQLSNRLPVVEEVLGAAVEVGEFYCEVDADDVVDRAHDVLEADLAVDRAFGALVGFAASNVVQQILQVGEGLRCPSYVSHFASL